MHGHETMSGLGSCIATALQCIDALEWAKHGNEHDPAEVLLGAVQVARPSRTADYRNFLRLLLRHLNVALRAPR
jgi:hypothetical protein